MTDWLRLCASPGCGSSARWCGGRGSRAPRTPAPPRPPRALSPPALATQPGAELKQGESWSGEILSISGPGPSLVSVISLTQTWTRRQATHHQLFKIDTIDVHLIFFIIYSGKLFAVSSCLFKQALIKCQDISYLSDIHRALVSRLTVLFLLSHLTRLQLDSWKQWVLNLKDKRKS